MSANTQILNHFKSGKSLTKLECISKFKYINLGDVVYRLRKRGFQIERNMIGTNEGKRYAVYWMKKSH